VTTFFTADTHFGHEAIIGMLHRPFGSVEEMDEAMIANWNAVVGPKDDVWHLGDFAYRAHPASIMQLYRRLNGRKRLIIGNHDKKPTLALPWMEPPAHRAFPRLEDGARVVLDHYAGRTWMGAHHGVVQLFGHSHGRMPGNSQSLDVGVDCWDFRPAAWDEIQVRLATLPPFRPVDDDAEAGPAAEANLVEAHSSGPLP
jgi:calcineurin-like phosphoesterase family protein